MARVVMGPRASERLGAIVLDRRRSVGFVAARALQQRIMGRVYQLRQFPELGRLVPEKPDEGVRELIVPPYRILYEFDGDTVTILNIIHGRMVGSEEDEDGD